MKGSIRTKLILAIGLPLVAVYLAMLGVEYRLGKKEALTNMAAYLRAVTSGKAGRMDVQFSRAAQVAKTTADLLSLRPSSAGSEIESILRRNLEHNEDIFGMCLAFEPGKFSPGVKYFAPYVFRAADGRGLRVTNIQPGNGYDYTTWDWFLLPKLLNKPAWSDPYFDEGAGNILMCTYSAPFYRGGKYLGVVTVDVGLENIRRELSKMGIEDGYCSILSNTGTFISDPDESLVMKESIFSLAEWYGRPELAAVGREMIAGRQGTWRMFDYTNKGGAAIWMVFVPIRTTGWSMLAVIPEEKVMAPVYRRLERELGILVVGLVVIMGILVAVSFKITGPLGRLARATRELAKGNLEVKVSGVSGGDEIGELAETFNKMIAELKSNIEARIHEESARKAVESELKVARGIQASLLPRIFPPFPDRKEFDLHAVNEPAKFIAGDFFDFFFVNEDTLAVVMADVSGKGVPAAMFMAVARTAIRNFTVPGKSPAQILKHVNDVMARDNDNTMFVTLFYGFYNVRTGKLTFANAGHNPPYILRKGGGLETLEPTGPILAVFDDAEYTESRINLNPGEVLVLFTDGVTEAMRGGELYGTKRFEPLLLSIAGQKVENICQTIIDTVIEYGGRELHDDVTLLALRRNF